MWTRMLFPFAGPCRAARGTKGRKVHHITAVVDWHGKSARRLPQRVVLQRTSRTCSHKLLTLLAISFMGHVDLKNN
jgi:hypothetical protein